ncbi:hypothetical protein [Vibrio hepatarius]|uniref:hypothetical protein n=1 Tax=Vibrio hepatarius TaxID=171383 RepID=UPI001C0A236F|nr:hypothetical protein [Vibrio hepatarius]MBU2898339.1 hypothetical protein [Vibrio hepatarius]
MIEKEIDKAKAKAKADFNNALEKNQSMPATEGWILKTKEDGIPKIQSSKAKSYQEVSLKYNAMKVKGSNTLS